jgi:hypothetical protein
MGWFSLAYEIPSGIIFALLYFLKFCGLTFICTGVFLSGFGWFAIFSERRERWLIWGSSNIGAAIFIWHGFSFLLGQ